MNSNKPPHWFTSTFQLKETPSAYTKGGAICHLTPIRPTIPAGLWTSKSESYSSGPLANNVINLFRISCKRKLNNY